MTTGSLTVGVLVAVLVAVGVLVAGGSEVAVAVSVGVLVGGRGVPVGVDMLVGEPTVAATVDVGMTI